MMWWPAEGDFSWLCTNWKNWQSLPQYFSPQFLMPRWDGSFESLCKGLSKTCSQSGMWQLGAEWWPKMSKILPCFWGAMLHKMGNPRTFEPKHLIPSLKYVHKACLMNHGIDPSLMKNFIQVMVISACEVVRRGSWENLTFFHQLTTFHQDAWCQCLGYQFEAHTKGSQQNIRIMQSDMFWLRYSQKTQKWPFWCNFDLRSPKGGVSHWGSGWWVCRPFIHRPLWDMSKGFHFCVTRRLVGGPLATGNIPVFAKFPKSSLVSGRWQMCVENKTLDQPHLHHHPKPWQMQTKPCPTHPLPKAQEKTLVSWTKMLGWAMQTHTTSHTSHTSHAFWDCFCWTQKNVGTVSGHKKWVARTSHRITKSFWHEGWQELFSLGSKWFKSDSNAATWLIVEWMVMNPKKSSGLQNGKSVVKSNYWAILWWLST